FFPFGSGLTSKRRFLRYSASDMFDDNVRSRASIDNLVPFLTSDASSTTLVTSSTPATRATEQPSPRLPGFPAGGWDAPPSAPPSSRPGSVARCLRIIPSYDVVGTSVPLRRLNGSVLSREGRCPHQASRDRRACPVRTIAARAVPPMAC